MFVSFHPFDVSGTRERHSPRLLCLPPMPACLARLADAEKEREREAHQHEPFVPWTVTDCSTFFFHFLPLSTGTLRYGKSFAASSANVIVPTQPPPLCVPHYSHRSASRSLEARRWLVARMFVLLDSSRLWPRRRAGAASRMRR